MKRWRSRREKDKKEKEIGEPRLPKPTVAMRAQGESSRGGWLKDIGEGNDLLKLNSIFCGCLVYNEIFLRSIKSLLPHLKCNIKIEEIYKKEKKRRTRRIWDERDKSLSH